jgi:hypothetical protein
LREKLTQAFFGRLSFTAHKPLPYTRLKIDALFFYNQRTPQNLGVDGPDILPQDSDKKQNHRTKEKDPNQSGGDPQGEPFPKQ